MSNNLKNMETKRSKVLHKIYNKEQGREFIITEDRFNHIYYERNRTYLTKERLASTIRSIKMSDESLDNLGQIVSWSQNGIFAAYRDNVIYTAFDDPKGKYYKNHTRKGVSKWIKGRLSSL